MRGYWLVLLSLGIGAIGFAFDSKKPPSQAAELEWIKVDEDRSSGLRKLTYPKVIQKGNAVAAARVNQAIDELAKDWRCDLNPEAEKKPEFQVSTQVHLMKYDILSFSLQFDYDCGGPYPNHFSRSLTFDLRSGNPIDLKDLFNSSLDLKRLERLALKQPIAESECQEVYEARSGALSWNFYLMETHLVIYPEFPHALQACVQEFKIPASEIKKWIRSDGVLGRWMR